MYILESVVFLLSEHQVIFQVSNATFLFKELDGFQVYLSGVSGERSCAQCYVFQ